MSKAVEILEYQAMIVRQIGEDQFLEYLKKISIENNLTLYQRIAEITSSIFEIERNTLLYNISQYDRNVTASKDVFIYICLQYNLKKDLYSNGYYKQRITKAKNNINTLIPKNPEHKIILENIEKIKLITEKNLKHE
jgi:hypothetical protein